MWGVYDYHRGGVCGRVYVYQGGVYVYQGPIDIEQGLGEGLSIPLLMKSLLASILRDEGNFGEAEGLELDGLKKKMAAYGEENAGTISSLSNLGITYKEQDRWKESEDVLFRTKDMYTRVVGNRHPDTLVSARNLASVYKYQGRWKDAEILLTETLET
jgi:Tetratricopeptide repeat